MLWDLNCMGDLIWKGRGTLDLFSYHVSKNFCKNLWKITSINQKVPFQGNIFFWQDLDSKETYQKFGTTVVPGTSNIEISLPWNILLKHIKSLLVVLQKVKRVEISYRESIVLCKPENILQIILKFWFQQISASGRHEMA